MDSVASEEEASKSGGPSGEDLTAELCSLIEVLREEVQAVREELRSLRSEDSGALLTREEAAERLRISTRTLDDMEAAGEIRAVRIRGRVLYHPEVIEAYIRRSARREGRS